MRVAPIFLLFALVAPTAFAAPVCVNQLFVSFCADPPLPATPDVTAKDAGTLSYQGGAITISPQGGIVPALGGVTFHATWDASGVTSGVETFVTFSMLVTGESAFYGSTSHTTVINGTTQTGEITLSIAPEDAAVTKGVVTLMVQVSQYSADTYRDLGAERSSASIQLVNVPAAELLATSDVRPGDSATLATATLSRDSASATMESGVTLVSVSGGVIVRATIDLDLAPIAPQFDSAYEQAYASMYIQTHDGRGFANDATLLFSSCYASMSLCGMPELTGTRTIEVFVPAEALDPHTVLDVSFYLQSTSDGSGATSWYHADASAAAGGQEVAYVA